MRNYLNLLLLIFIIGCGPSAAEKWRFPKTTFESSFPKKNINLTRILGEEVKIVLHNKNLPYYSLRTFLKFKESKLSLESFFIEDSIRAVRFDTLVLKIYAYKDHNVIINIGNNDTLFNGKVCKFRGMYYFNEKISDTSYWIYPVRIYNNLIFGLSNGVSMLHSVDNLMENGKFNKLLKWKDANNIRLSVNKKELKPLFNFLMDSIYNVADTIIINKPAEVQFKSMVASIPTQPDVDENELINKVYPNPVKDFINIELSKMGQVHYELISMEGKTIIKGEIKDLSHKINMSKYKKGTYILTLLDDKKQIKESIKIIKE